jgi:ABC-type sugar transport system substrate-binding protein
MSSDNRHQMPRRRLQTAAVLAAGLVAAMSIPVLGQQDPSAPSKLSEFEPFVPSDTVGAVPDLPRRAAFMVPNTIAYYTDIGAGIEAGAATKDVEFALVSSEADPVKNIDQINQEIQRGIGCLIVQPQDAAAQAVVLQTAIDQGIYVNFFVTPPANTQTMADQYDLGYQQAKTAVEWIDANLGGEAVVANFTLDFIEALIPRREGTEAALAEGGEGIEVIDVPVLQDSPDEGFRLASTLLQSRPDINVWIGPDSTVLSVNAYLESIGKDPAVDMIYLTGLNGEQEALDAISAGDTFMKSTWGFNNALLGYAMGAFCGDWLDGKAVPQVLQVGGTEATSAEEVDALQLMIDDPAGQFDLLLAGTQDGNKIWGSTSFEEKDNYLRNIITGG